MNVLSLFDGMSCGRIALERAGIEVTTYYASEIDKYATIVSEANFPDIVRLGDVTKWQEWGIEWSSIDMIFAGFPCQAWSMAGKQMGDKDERGMLFWTMLDIMKHVNAMRKIIGKKPAHFLIENVKMKKEFEEYITHHTECALGKVHKILINSALVSAQNRNRYYWTSFPVTQPEDKGIMLIDIIEMNPKSPTIMSERFCERNSSILRDDVSGKAKTLSAMEYVKNGRQGDYIASHILSDAALARMERKKYSKPQIMPIKTGTLNTKNNSGQLSMDSGTTLIPILDDIGSYEDWIKKTEPYGGTREEYDALVLQEVLVKCGAIRGRYIVNGKRADNTVDSMAGKTKQRLELRKDDKTNTLTTVQKDNQVVIIQKPRGKNAGGLLAKDGKTPTLSANSWEHNNHLAIRDKSKCARSGGVGSPPDSRHNWDFALDSKVYYRKLVPLECERLQTIQDNYTLVIDENGKQIVSNTQRYKMIGNGWTIDVIVHALDCLVIHEFNQLFNKKAA